MKFRLIVLTALVFLTGQVKAQEQPVFNNQKEKVSYAIGMDLGRTFRQQSIDLDPAMLSQGAADALSGEKTRMTEKEMADTLTAFQRVMMAKMTAHIREMGEKNKREGEAFLAENKKKEGVVTLPDGLEYRVIEAGSGKKPRADDTVTVHYVGTLIDGTEFDSSYHRGKPASFSVSKVIPGWREALQLMQEGAKWQVIIPSELAYGERGMPRSKIGPHATLIFEIELISVQEKNS